MSRDILSYLLMTCQSSGNRELRLSTLVSWVFLQSQISAKNDHLGSDSIWEWLWVWYMAPRYNFWAWLRYARTIPQHAYCFTWTDGGTVGLRVASSWFFKALILWHRGGWTWSRESRWCTCPEVFTFWRSVTFGWFFIAKVIGRFLLRRS